jgi:hypothetical protein
MTDIEHDYGKAEDDKDVLKKDELHVNPPKKEDYEESFLLTRMNVLRIAQDEVLSKE